MVKLPLTAFNDDHESMVPAGADPYYAAPVVVIPDRKPREERKVSK